MKNPLLQDEAFLADVQNAESRNDSCPETDIWWLGQSGYLLQHRGICVLIDPYLSDSLTAKYSNTDKPHVRVTRRVVDPARLGFVDAILSTHNHTDHLDRETIGPILAAKPRVSMIVPEANRQFAANRLGVAPARLVGVVDSDTQWVRVAKGFYARGVPASHEAIERDAAGRCVFLGYEIAVGLRHIYHSGDTILYDGMVDSITGLRGRNYARAPDIALLPINGKVGNMSGREAAQLAKDIGAKLVIPCHYDMFEFNTADPADEFIPECQRLGQPYRVLQQGERFSSADIPA
jgi:L-ascorbate metabolism protein UlaG (beta-lactamase superfamily)